MDAFDKLVEKHFPQAGPLQTLVDMVEEQLDGFTPNKKILQERGARERDRVLRLPNVIPTEFSVGQRPGSEERQQFEL